MMLKKFAFAAGVASLALSPVLASPESESEDAALDRAIAETEEAGKIAEEARDAAKKAGEAAAKAGDYTPTTDYSIANELNPFAGLEQFALKQPIVDLPKPDPARLAVAEKVAIALYADGTSGRLFTAVRTELFQPVFNRFWTMKESEAEQLFGMPETAKPLDEDGKRPDLTLGETLIKDDPDAKARVEAFVTVYLDLIGDMSGALEPDLRGAMARDLARRYTLVQLNDMAAFFATPTGKAFARDYWLSNVSLDIIQTSLMNWPKMMKAVPDFVERLKKADAHLPPAPKGSPFAIAPVPAYGSSLPECAQDGDESDCTDEDWAAWDATNSTADAAQAAADAAVDAAMAVADEGELRAAWTKADRKAVEALEAKQSKLWEDHSKLDEKINAAGTELDEAIQKARRNAGQDTEPSAPPIMVVPTPEPDSAD